MYEEQAFVKILKEFIIIENCLKDEKNKSNFQYLKGRKAGIEYCISKLGYEFHKEENEKWIIRRKID